MTETEQVAKETAEEAEDLRSGVMLLRLTAKVRGTPPENVRLLTTLADYVERIEKLRNSGATGRGVEVWGVGSVELWEEEETVHPSSRVLGRIGRHRESPRLLDNLADAVSALATSEES